MNILTIGKLSSAFRIWELRFRRRKDVIIFLMKIKFNLKKVSLHDMISFKNIFSHNFLIFVVVENLETKGKNR